MENQCHSSHIEADGKLKSVFHVDSNPNHFYLVSIEIFQGYHVSLSPMVLTCPICGIYVARPYDPNLKYHKTSEPRKSELFLNKRHQRRA